MPPKKGKKGASKKKKKGSKGKKSKLSSQEKFLQFQITSQSDARGAFKTRKESLAVQNAELDAVLARVLEERNRIVRLFRQQSEGIAAEIHETETATTMSIRGAIQEKHAFQQELQQEADSLKAHLQEMKDEFAETTASIDFYTNYRTNEHDQLAHQIASLKRAIEGEEKSFENEKIEIRERFERSKQLLLGITEKKLQDTKRRATDFALDRQGVKDKMAWSDLSWLHRELRHHSMESERLQSVCESLEESNVHLLRRMSHESSGPLPVWWENAQSYKEHAERKRLESLMAEMPEEDDEDSHEEDEDESGEEDDIFEPSPPRAPATAPAVHHTPAPPGPLPPMKRGSLPHFRLSRPGLTPHASETPSVTTVTQISPGRGSGPISPRIAARNSISMRRSSSSSSMALPEDLSRRVENLVLFPTLARQSSVHALMPAAPPAGTSPHRASAAGRNGRSSSFGLL